MIRLLHASDIHFGCENHEAVEAAAAFARSGGFDLIVLTGDLTQNGRRREFEAAAGWLAGLPRPWIATPGNHDTPYLNLAARLIAPFAAYGRATGRPARDQTFAAPGLCLRAANTARGAQARLNWSKGAIGFGQIAAAEAAFDAAPAGALKVFACHHPLTEALGAPMTGRVRGGRQAARRLNLAGADLILTGHVHIPFVAPAPFGDGRTYAVGAGTLSRRERGAPAGFNVVEADAATIAVTAYGWNGRDFTPWRAWASPRRGAG